MDTEKHIHIEGEPMPITVCPQCVESGFQIDPRDSHPDYPVILSTCRTHRISNGEFDDLINQGGNKSAE